MRDYMRYETDAEMQERWKWENRWAMCKPWMWPVVTLVLVTAAMWEMFRW